MQGCRKKDLVDAVRQKAKKLCLTPEDVEEAVEWARRGEKTTKSLIEALQSSQSWEEEVSMFGPNLCPSGHVLDMMSRWVSIFFPAAGEDCVCLVISRHPWPKGRELQQKTITGSRAWQSQKRFELELG